MSMHDFFVVFATCLVTMLLCRCLPLFVLKGRQLPEGLARALGFIPPAAPCRLSLQRWWSWSRARPSRCCGAPLPVAPAMRCWRSASPRAQCKAGHSRIAGWAPVSLCGAFPLSDGVSFLVGRAPTSAISVGRFDGKIEAFG